MFRCLSRRTGVSLLALVLFLSGCNQYHLLIWTDPQTCVQCAEDMPRVKQLEQRVKVRYLAPNTSPDGKIPYYKLYSKDGKLIYKGHDIEKVHP